MRGSLSEIAGLYAILDFPLRHALAPMQVLDAMLAGGAKVVQLRSKHAPLDPQLVTRLAGRCQEAACPLIINDELELAERGIPGVAGVHLGQSDLPRLGSTPEQRRTRRAALARAGLVLGVSTHDLAQLGDTLASYEPDYVGFGPVFATASKQNPEPTVGLAALTQACHDSNVAVVAIGGISLATLPSIARAGAAAFAVIGALAAPSPDEIRERARSLVSMFDECR